MNIDCSEIRRTAIGLAERSVEQHTAAAGGLSCRNIAPSIPDHEAALKVETPLSSGREEQTGFRFAAFTTIGRIVVASECIEQWELLAQLFVDGLNHRARLPAASDIRLVGYHHQRKSRRPQPPHSLWNLRQQLQFIDIQRRSSSAVLGECPIQHSIAIQENNLAIPNHGDILVLKRVTPLFEKCLLPWIPILSLQL
jgi:hypothetical protein